LLPNPDVVATAPPARPATGHPLLDWIFDDVNGDHYNRSFGYVLSHVMDPSLAEDLTQEGFLKVHRQILAGKKIGPAYIYVVMKHTVIDYYRKPKLRMEPLPDGAESKPGAGWELHLSRSDLNGEEQRVHNKIEVDRFLARISPKQAQVVRMHDLEGRNFSAIAAELKVSVSTVHQRYIAGRAALKALGERDQPSAMLR
jgi:RNA polymerase sigma-70 factor (ECF subfamily)